METFPFFRSPAMNATGLPPDPPGRERFNQNRTEHPPELLLPYANQHVAWSADGTRLLASAPAGASVGIHPFRWQALHQ